MDLDDDVTARELAKGIIADVAPEELQFFDELVDSKVTNSETDQYLGFGVEAGMALLSGVVAVVGRELSQFIWQHGKDAAGVLVKELAKASQEALIKRYKLWLLEPSGSKSPISLRPNDLQAVTTKIGKEPEFSRIEAKSQADILEWIHAKFGDG